MADEYTADEKIERQQRTPDGGGMLPQTGGQANADERRHCHAGDDLRQPYVVIRDRIEQIQTPSPPTPQLAIVANATAKATDRRNAMHRLILALLLLGATPAAAADLALKRVMLSSAGVGYFEYETEVDGPATLGLDVPLDQVDDVLTSLVVFDSAGAVGTLELPGRDNTRANFGNVPFGPAALQSSVDYLNSLQGVEISVQGPRPMTGRIVHADRVAETLPAPPGQPQATVQRTRVTILSPEGLRQFVLEEADSIQVTRSRTARAHRPGT